MSQPGAKNKKPRRRATVDATCINFAKFLSSDAKMKRETPSTNAATTLRPTSATQPHRHSGGSNAAASTSRFPRRRSLCHFESSNHSPSHSPTSNYSPGSFTTAASPAANAAAIDGVGNSHDRNIDFLNAKYEPKLSSKPKSILRGSQFRSNSKNDFLQRSMPHLYHSPHSFNDQKGAYTEAADEEDFSSSSPSVAFSSHSNSSSNCGATPINTNKPAVTFRDVSVATLYQDGSYSSNVCKIQLGNGGVNGNCSGNNNSFPKPPFYPAHHWHQNQYQDDEEDEVDEHYNQHEQQQEEEELIGVIGLTWTELQTQTQGIYSGTVNARIRPHGKGEFISSSPMNKTDRDDDDGLLIFSGEWMDGMFVSGQQHLQQHHHGVDSRKDCFKPAVPLDERNGNMGMDSNSVDCENEMENAMSNDDSSSDDDSYCSGNSDECTFRPICSIPPRSPPSQEGNQDHTATKNAVYNQDYGVREASAVESPPVHDSNSLTTNCAPTTTYNDDNNIDEGNNDAFNNIGSTLIQLLDLPWTDIQSRQKGLYSGTVNRRIHPHGHGTFVYFNEIGDTNNEETEVVQWEGEWCNGHYLIENRLGSKSCDSSLDASARCRKQQQRRSAGKIFGENLIGPSDNGNAGSKSLQGGGGDDGVVASPRFIKQQRRHSADEICDDNLVGQHLSSGDVHHGSIGEHGVYKPSHQTKQQRRNSTGASCNKNVVGQHPSGILDSDDWGSPPSPTEKKNPNFGHQILHQHDRTNVLPMTQKKCPFKESSRKTKSLSPSRANRRCSVGDEPNNAFDKRPHYQRRHTTGTSYYRGKYKGEKNFSPRCVQSRWAHETRHDYHDDTPTTDSHVYHLGEPARSPHDMVLCPSAEEVMLSLSSLNKHDFAFIKRSNSEWTYAIVADRLGSSDGTKDEIILFVIDEKGATKVIKKNQWASCIRRFRNPKELDDSNVGKSPNRTEIKIPVNTEDCQARRFPHPKLRVLSKPLETTSQTVDELHETSQLFNYVMNNSPTFTKTSTKSALMVSIGSNDNAGTHHFVCTKHTKTSETTCSDDKICNGGAFEKHNPCQYSNGDELVQNSYIQIKSDVTTDEKDAVCKDIRADGHDVALENFRKSDSFFDDSSDDDSLGSSVFYA